MRHTFAQLELSCDLHLCYIIIFICVGTSRSKDDLNVDSNIVPMMNVASG